jgi:DNA end-binding protein Ku
MSVRATWSGSIGFGMVSISVKLTKATERHDVSFKQVTADGSRVKYQRVSEATGEPLEFSDIQKGYETDQAW